MQHKFKGSILEKQAIQELEFEKGQDKLKNKYGIDKDVVVVEKSNILRILGDMIRITAKILILLFASIGVISLIYPNPRKEVIDIITYSLSEIIKLIGV